MSAPSTIAAATALLFVPATRPDRFARALATGADAIVIDLEDGVAPDARDAARESLTAAIAAFGAAQRARALLRINAVDTRWHAAEVVVAARLVSEGVASVMLPKADSATQVENLARALGPQGCVVPLVESCAGLSTVDGLAEAMGVTRLAFGNLDLTTDLGIACDEAESELIPTRFALVHASRRRGIAAPLDGVTPDARNALRVGRDASRAVRMGFGAKLRNHPDQVASVRDAFRPTPAELDWARRVAVEADAGKALFTLDGRMADAPVIASARRTLARIGHAGTPYAPAG